MSASATHAPTLPVIHIPDALWRETGDFDGGEGWMRLALTERLRLSFDGVTPDVPEFASLYVEAWAVKDEDGVQAVVHPGLQHLFDAAGEYLQSVSSTVEIRGREYVIVILS